MPIHTRVSGVWQQVTEIHARVSGTWREVKEGWVKDGGTWRQFFSSLFVDSHTIVDAGIILKGSGSAEARFSVDSDGGLSSSSGVVSPAYDDSAEWLPNGTPGDWHVRVTATGDTPDMGGLSLNTWYACTSDRTWTVGVSGGSADSATVTLTVEFSNDAGSSVAYTFTDVIDMTASIA